MPEGYLKFMTKKIIIFALLLFYATIDSATAQPAMPHRIGVILPGGPLHESVEGLRHGLRELGLVDGKQFTLAFRVTKVDAKTAEEAARDFEREKVPLLYVIASSVIAAVKSATANTPIVFTIGSDPVALGLVNDFATPGGRLTGIHYPAKDLTSKRLEILKEMLPRVGRVLTIYDPKNNVAKAGAALAREEAKRLGLKLIERNAHSIDEFRKALQEIKSKEADAFFYIPDAMVVGQAQLIIDTAKAKSLPTMFQEQSLVAKGGLASYGQNYFAIGRLSAKYVQRVLTGTPPKDLKIETVDSVELAINLQTAKQLGVTIPPQVLARAQKVIK
jgi:putative ABC transport system substrate-binding protein